jgi:hypothetical protein
MSRNKDHAMNATWHPDEDVTPSPGEVDAMASVLEGRHGRFAAEVADFFSTLHSQHGDAGRCWAWAGVAELIRKRERERVGSADR